MVQPVSSTNWMKPVATLIAFVMMDVLFVSIKAPSGVYAVLFYAIALGGGIALYVYEKMEEDQQLSATAVITSQTAQTTQKTKAKIPASRRKDAAAYKAERDTNRELCRTMTSIKVNTTELLLSLVEKHDLDFVNNVTCIYRAAKLTQGIRGYGPNPIFTDARFVGILKQLEEKLEDAEVQIFDGNTPAIEAVLPRGLANVTWALAKLGLEPTAEYIQLLHRIARLATPRCRQFKSQELSNLVWAFSTIFSKAWGKSDEKLVFPNMRVETRVILTELFQAVAQTSAANLFTFRPQELSNIVWAYSRAMQGTPLATLADSSAIYDPLEGSLRLFFKALARAVRAKVHEFEPQQVANTAWAFARMEVLQQSDVALLLQSLATAASEPSISNRLKPQEVSNLTWSLGKSGVDCPVLFDAISSRLISEGFQGYTGQDYANTAWAFARSNRMTKDFVDALMKACEPQLLHFKPVEITTLLWSCTKSGYATSMCPALKRGVRSYNGHATSDVWACGASAR